MPSEEKATRLGLFLEDAAHPDHIWFADELSALFRHQMAAPVEFDLTTHKNSDHRQLAQLAEASGLLIKSFKDLLAHPHPPADLLIMTKDFAKASRISKKPALPKDIAHVLYFASIAVAMVRCRRRISTLSDRDIVKGLRWGQEQPWVDDWLKTLLRDATREISGIRRIDS
jgi:hypothetical protein